MVKIEHAVLATKFLRGKGGKDMAASQRNMKGYLYGHDGSIIKRYHLFYHTGKKCVQHVTQKSLEASTDF